ncbi:group 3 secretory phospholipase A2 [Chiloscyllium plagiosum]|uniref:group 3 secretory phospholipase A2 n=1 Tax=Chiloscyllium plagiosum TaxID=36176 RepID=UPI001CB85CA1|nr:group 3 secretory phospholipase A2 [Chiloscyllium plagiosum]
MLYIHAHLSVCTRVFSRQTFSMFLSGGLYCLLFFPLIQGRHETLSRDRLVGLSQRDRSLCHLVAGDHSAHSLSFLARLRGFNDGPVLFQSSWSRQGQLEQCIFWQEATITSAYLAFCLEKQGKPLSTGTFLTEWDSRLDTALRDLEQWARNCSSPLLSAAGPESPRGRRSAALAPLGKPDSPGSASFLQDHRPGARRSRRTLTFPGTVWCGPGNSAENFTSLGIFDQTDLCCRAHDHCEHRLSAFEYNYGVWNFRLHTISHCDCDYRFRRCLLNVNDTISTVVGIAFFNVLQVPCFNLEPDEGCIKKTQRSHCNITERMPRAVLRSQPMYNYIHPILDEFQMGMESKTTASSAATSRQSQIITSLSTGSTTHDTLTKSTQKVKSTNKKCHKCKGHQKKKTKTNSQNILKTKADMMPTMVPTELAFNPAIEQNSVPVAMEKKDGPRKLLQRNVSDALMNQVNGTMAVGLDENNSKEHSFTILGRQNTATSLSKSVESTTLSSKNRTGIKLAKTMYNIKNKVSSSFISSRKAFDLSSFSKNSSLKSLPSGSDRKGHAPKNLPCRMGNWNHSEIIISSPCAHQPLDPIRRRPTASKGKSRGCNIYKALDRCEHKISPQEFKFSYHNQQSRTLYHCDCVKRLAKQMKKRVNVSTVEWLLTEFVSQSCFWLKSVPRNCSNEEWRHCATQSGSTVAVLSKPRHLQRILQHLGIIDEYLNPLTDEQERYKNGTSNVTNSIKLYDKCLQLTQA